MAQSFTTQSGVVLRIPGTVVDLQVRANQGGTAAAGVVTLVGEADEGPDFTKESSLDSNGFAPDDISSVISKYGTGRLVDAFREIAAAAADPNIVGSVSLVKLVKTNPSEAAEALLARAGFGSYASVLARREGQPGNLIKYQSAVSVPETAPTTGKFSYTPHYSVSAVAFSLRQNGSGKDNFTIAEVLAGPAFATAIEDLSLGTLCTGATEKLPLTGKVGNIAVTVLDSPNGVIQISLPGLIDADQLPVAGDSLVIPADSDYSKSGDSVILGATGQNRASYVVTAVNNSSGTSTITAKRINTPSGATAVEAVSAVALVDDMEFICFTQAEIKNLTGMDRQSTVGMSSVTFNTTSNDGSQFTMTLSQNWFARPSAGDTVMVPSTFAGVASGFYQVLSSTFSSFTCQRLSNGSAGTTGSHTTAGPILPNAQPFTVYKPVIDGLGKSMEIVGTPASIARNPQSAAAASWTSGNPLLTSASEYQNAFTISRGTTSDTFTSGGEIVASFSCDQESAVVIVGVDGLDFQVSSVSQFTLAYKNLPTMQDVVDQVNSHPGFYAVITAAKFSAIASSSLDRGTFKLSASNAVDNRPARLKRDASQFQLLASGGGLATVALAEGTQSGLPEVVSPAQFLSGGSKAGSTSADFVDALDACEAVDTNFIGALISQDASADILEEDTESSSTYSIDSVNAGLKSHVILMSALKARKNRVAVVSHNGTYDEVKQAAGQMASFRVAMAFQDVKALGSDGTIQQFQPWMAAVVAMGMQAAAGYKGIVKKFANISGIVDPSGFMSGKPSDLEDALSAGLLILESVRTGGFRWVSDQTTYSLDNNFVYNSLQAVYIADLMALTLIQNFDLAIVGKSVAEISAAAALSFLDAQMFNFLRLRWTAPSDDAPRGYKNASVKLIGGVLNIYLEAKLAGLIYFVPIQFEISQVEQSA